MRSYCFYIALLIFLFPVILHAQNNKTVLAPPTSDFTMVSMNNDTFNLYTELDAGKIVLLDFFATSCPTCQQNTPKLDSNWQAYGYGGDSLWVWGIEISSFDSNYVADIDTFEANYGGNFPIFSTFQNTDSVLTLYNITWTPQYYLVNPVTKVITPRLQITELDSAIQAIQQQNTGQNSISLKDPDIKFLSSEIIISGIDKPSALIKLISIDGKTIINKNVSFENGTGIIPINELKNGLYIVYITSQSQSFSKIFYYKR